MTNIASKILELDDGVYVIPGSTNIGVITDVRDSVTDVYLVDSGSSEIDADYILDILHQFFNETETEYVIKAIINTHSHADHCGGNHYIHKQTACEVWVHEKEKSTLENSYIQGAMIWGGYPPHEFRTLYYKQEDTRATRIFSERLIIKLSGNRYLSFIELPGHFFANTGIVIENKGGRKIIFTGDAIFPRDEIRDHWIPFLINPRDFCSSLDKLAQTENLSLIVPSHGNFINNVYETAELNKIAILENFNCILECLKDGPKTSEQIIKYVADKNELNMGLAQYHLVGSTLRSYLSVLHDEKTLAIQVKDNELKWFLNSEK